MKKKKVLELVEKTQNFGDVWDFLEQLYESGGKEKHTVGVTNLAQGWSCEVIKQTEKLVGKEIKYQRSSVLKEKGDTMYEATKTALLSYARK